MTDSPKKVIFTCSCSGVPTKAKTAYKLLLKDENIPEMRSNPADRKKFSETLPKGKARDYLLSLSTKHKRFAYYFELSDDRTEVIDAWNLLLGRRIV